jgi:hypothetical protein
LWEEEVQKERVMSGSEYDLSILYACMKTE